MTYLLLALFGALTAMGADQEQRYKVRAMRRDSITSTPMTIVAYPLPDYSPVAMDEDTSDEDYDSDAQQIDEDLDTLVNEIRVQQANDDEPGLRSYPPHETPEPIAREPSRRNIYVPVAQPQRKSFWERVAEWCTCSRARRR